MSNCSNCGTEIRSGQKFCHECGSPIRTVKADKDPKCKISLPEFDIDDSLDDNKASVKKYLLKLDKYCKRWSDDYPDGPLLGLFRHSLDMYDEILRECPTVASALPKSWKRNSDK